MAAQDRLSIWVMDRRWVLLGNGHQDRENALMMTLDHAAVIHRWGTSQGLGELAMKGPLENTQLNPEPPGVKINTMHLFREIPCDPAKWKDWMKKKEDVYPTQNKISIWVMDRRWVLLGSGRPDPDNALMMTLDHAAVIHRWGTSQGLGELAAKGPLENTQLNPEPPGVKINMVHLFREIPCDPSKWADWMKNNE